MMLERLITETKELGIIILYTDLPESKGRHLCVSNLKIIYLDKNLDDTEAFNVLLHERSHFINDDYNNSLSQIPTYSHRIEHQAEKDRIIDFMNLINTEYPIDENFNYLDYMENAHIPTKYENFVKELATQLYHENINIGRVS
ncbi:ImmA/IrrE family metallo-endopeptidase [Streptococcus suis]|nr:ImmA/IrrE family metallo-endopeptidase [Streptococcus suis]MDG3136902.1 ImmA/IrrE family metallo-endopeptidase [Streptococcus suis]